MIAPLFFEKKKRQKKIWSYKKINNRMKPQKKNKNNIKKK